MTNIAQRNDVIACLHKWKTSFKITQNQKEIDKCLNELVGEAQLMWFDYNEQNDFEDNIICKLEGFKAREELIDVWKLSNSLGLNQSWENIRVRIYRSFSKTFKNELGDILNVSDSTLKRTKLIEFIQKCEKCYNITSDDIFIKIAIDAKKIDLLLNNWIQSKAYDELSGVSHSLIANIGDDFIYRIADPKTISKQVEKPVSHVIELQNDTNKNKWIEYYAKNNILIHIGVFLVCSLILYSLFSKEETFMILEMILAIAVLNLMILFYFKFFYQERVNK